MSRSARVSALILALTVLVAGCSDDTGVEPTTMTVPSPSTTTTITVPAPTTSTEPPPLSSLFGGKTRLDNLCLLCARHHTLVHDGKV